MSAFKKGQRADGKYNVDVKTTPAKGDNPNGSGKGEELKSVWTSNDSPAIRGGRPDRDKTGR